MKNAMIAVILFFLFMSPSKAGTGTSDWRWYHAQFVSPWSSEVILKAGTADVILSGSKLSVRFLSPDGGGVFNGSVDSSGRVVGVERGFDPDGFPQEYRGLIVRSKVDLPEDVIVDDEKKYRDCFNRSILVEIDSGGGQVIVISEMSKCSRDIMELPIRDE